LAFVARGRLKMEVNAIQGSSQFARTEQIPKVQQQQPQQVQETPKEEPPVKPQEQPKVTGLLDIFA